MKSLLAFLAVLGLSLVIASAAIQPPSPVSADAAETDFSAERAMSDIRRIARAPHPTGSAENRHVRDYLVRRLEDMGLEVSIQRAEVLRARDPGWAAGAVVENIVATLPGEDRVAPVFLLLSHSDPARGSPGAASCTIAAPQSARTGPLDGSSMRTGCICSPASWTCMATLSSGR